MFEHWNKWSPNHQKSMHIFRFMYVSDASIEPFIMRCGLDAKSCSKIVTVDLVQPLSITFETNPDISKVSRLY